MITKSAVVAEVFKRIEAYKKSEGYQFLQKKSTEYKKQLFNYVQKYKDSEEQLEENRKNQVTNIKYGVGAVSHPRGCLSPELVTILTVENDRRGKLQNRCKKPHFIYDYNKDGMLIACHTTTYTSMLSYELKEYIMWENDKEVGTTFNAGALEAITEVSYDACGRLVKYLYGSTCEDKVDFLIMEEYTYAEHEVMVTWMEARSDDIDVDYYKFILDEEGYAVKYITWDDMEKDKISEHLPNFKMKFI